MKGLYWERKHLTMKPTLLCIGVYLLYYVMHKVVNLLSKEVLFAS